MRSQRGENRQGRNKLPVGTLSAGVPIFFSQLVIVLYIAAPGVLLLYAANAYLPDLGVPPSPPETPRPQRSRLPAW